MLSGEKNPLNESTGYGILTDNIGDAKVEIVIDCNRQEVIVKEINRDNERYTFKEFSKLATSDTIDNRMGDRRKDNDRRNS
tara:strand:- start:279 stop:521 length:243 start_codon:yes stop_codon:yes gene_type:complete